MRNHQMITHNRKWLDTFILSHYVFNQFAQRSSVEVFLVQKCDRAGLQAQPVKLTIGMKSL